MKAIQMLRGTHRAGQFIPLGRILKVPEDIALGAAGELVANGRAKWKSARKGSSTKPKGSAARAKRRA